MNISDLSSLLRPATLTELSLGAMWFLSVKTSDEEIEIRLIKTIIQVCEMLRQSLKIKKKIKKKWLKFLLRNLILGYPTWFSYLDWAVKTVVPLPGDDQIVILQAFVGLRKAGYQSNNIGMGLEVISRTSKGMALVHVNDVVPCEP